MGKDSESFADVIDRAQRTPNAKSHGANQDLPNLFTGFPTPEGETVVDNVPPSNKGQDKNAIIKGIPRYRLKAHIKRFIIGTLVTQVGAGPKAEYVTEERNDSTEYEALMDDMLSGKAVPRFEERNILKDGTLVIVVSYLAVLPKKDAGSGAPDTKS
jgi:hypothetical protein